MSDTNRLTDIGKRAKAASAVLASATSGTKNAALVKIGAALADRKEEILAANREDMEAARANGMRDSMLDRLALSAERIDALGRAVAEVAALDDPVGKVLGGSVRPNGLKISRVAVPLGVVAVIYEARPNVTADAASLCLKSGNAVILKGGREACRTNKVIADVMRAAAAAAGLPEDVIIFIEDNDRETTKDLMRLDGYVDVLLPRGGHGLIESVSKNASVPVIKTGEGNCHVYVDRDADVAKAVRIIYNAKTQRVSVCNTCESLVIHRDILADALPAIKAELDKKNVVMVGDEEARAVCPDVLPATEEDWATEYLDYKISVKTVGSVEEAVAHINANSTHHSESIITENYTAAQKFADAVDSAAVYVNASTRFTDGGEFGFGAEIGISTQKLHARGPVGLQELTSFKYIIRGDGQIRE